MSTSGPFDILDLVHDSVVVTGMDGRILHWNPASHALYGWSTEDAVGRHADELFGPTAPELSSAREDAIRDGRWRGEERRWTAAGVEILVELSWAVKRGGDGVPVAIVETGRDLTARRAAEIALRKSEHRYRNLFQAMAASFWELDFSLVADMLYAARKSGLVQDFDDHFTANPAFVRELMRATRVVDVNEQTVALFGRGDKAELLGSVEPFWPQESTSVFAASILAAIGGSDNFVRETRLATVDGRVFDALFTACFPPDTMNKGTLLVGVLDLSAQAEARLALARMQADLAHAARVSMLGELTASIAHEVNQPLAAIAAGAAAGLRWLSRDTPDLSEVQALTSRIGADARRAGDIIARIRTMASGAAPQRTAVEVNAVMEDAGRFLAHEIAKQGATLTTRLAPGLPQVEADRVQLQQVVVNLAMNALQAMAMVPGKRTVSFGTRPGKDATVEMVVEDDGPGIAPDRIGRVFDSFYTTKSGGMGLGLPIVRSIVEGFGGWVRVETPETGGTRFVVSLPALRPFEGNAP